MGLLSDFFLATAAELDSADLSSGPAQSLETLEWKGVDTIKLSRIEEWLTGADPGELEDEFVRESEDWIAVKLSHRLTTALAELDREAAKQFAKEWLLSDDDEELLSRLSGLARSARAKGKDMYIWMSP